MMQRWSETLAGGSGSLVMAEMANEKVQVYWYGWWQIALLALLTVALAVGWYRYSIASGTLHRMTAQGTSKKKALSNLKEAISLFLLDCYERGTLEKVLKLSGFTPPLPLAVIRCSGVSNQPDGVGKLVQPH